MPPQPPRSPSIEAAEPLPSDTQAAATPPAEGREEAGTAGFPSVGSAKHSAGECCPCAWFWKPQGCLNGASCTRCHLCPQGEVKARKKAAKETQVRQQREKKELQEREPAYVSVPRLGKPPSVTPAALSPLDAVPHKNTFIHYSDPTPDAYGDGPPVYSAPCILSHLPEATTTCANPVLGVALGELPQTRTSTAPAAVAAAPHQKDVPDSAHERGECKPCSYFWYKADGCRHGDQCNFCHLCEKGESKKRKKEKIRALKAAGSFHQATAIGEREDQY